MHWAKNILPIPAPSLSRHLSEGQSLCGQIVPKSSRFPSGFHIYAFPDAHTQHALSALLLRLPREVRTLIYKYVYDVFKSYTGALVAPDMHLRMNDTFMLNTETWYSISRFQGQAITSGTVLGLDAAPQAVKNVAHLFKHTPARHLRSLDARIFEECVNDLCIKAGSVLLKMKYRDHCIEQRYDTTLFNLFGYHARDLVVSIKYSGLHPKSLATHASSSGSGGEGDDKLVAVDDLCKILKQGCKTTKLTLHFVFDVPFPANRRLTVSEDWVRDRVKPLTDLGFDVHLHVYNVYDERDQARPHPCAVQEHSFSYQSSHSAGRGWSNWERRQMSLYDAAALEA